MTITAKFWHISDFLGDPTAHAASYVAAMNEALDNSRIPIVYKRWGCRDNDIIIMI